MTLHLYLLAIVMGAVMSIYVPMISQSAKVMGAAVMGNVPFFFVAFLTSVIVAVANGDKPMHPDLLRYFLPIYLITFFVLVFVLRTLLVYRRTGINAETLWR